MSETLRILLVDDNEGCRDLYALWLGEHNVVETASNGPLALDVIDSDIDLVLIDRNMPGPSGREVAREMRANGYEGGIIMVSSQPLDFELHCSPFDNYVQKPADRGEIERAVERFATRDRLRSRLDEFYALTATLAEIEADDPATDPRTTEAYARTKRLVEQKRTAVSEVLETGVIDWETAFTVLEETDCPETPGSIPTDQMAQINT